MSTNKSSRCAYHDLKKRLRILLKDLEERYKTLNLNSINRSMEDNKGDYSKLSKKSYQTDHLKKSTSDGATDYSYGKFGQERFSNGLEKRHNRSIAEITQTEKYAPLNQFDINYSPYYNMGDGKNFPAFEMNKKLEDLKEKCQRLRYEQLAWLDWCSNNPMYLESYANDYSNQYNEFIQAYADRIAAMSELCAEYKRIIQRQHRAVNAATSSTDLNQFYCLDEISGDNRYTIKILNSDLKQINRRLQKEVENIEVAMKQLHSIQQ